MTATWFAGLDLGQAKDPTALTVVQQAPSRPRLYGVRKLKRWPLGTGYPAIVDAMTELMRAEPMAAMGVLVVDGTGVGRPVVDMFRARLGTRMVPVTIHGGAQTTYDKETGYWSVPKRELVGIVQVLLQTRRLRIPSALPEATTLTHELQAFRAHISAGGHDSYGAGATPDDWRGGGPHDDMVLATALAVWYAERVPKPRPFEAAVAGYRPNMAAPEPGAQREQDLMIRESQLRAQVAEQMRLGEQAGYTVIRPAQPRIGLRRNEHREREGAS